MIQGIGNDIVEIPAFGHDITEVRAMGELVWQKQTSIPDYLCFTALEAGQFTLTIKASVGVGNLRYMEWSKDGKTWNHVDNEASVKKSIPVDVAVGDKVYWRGQGANMTASSAAIANCSQFSSTARFDVSGHIMSLLKGDDFLNYQHLTNYDTDGVRNVTFAYLFYGCTTLVNAKDLILPTFTSWYSYIYRALFYGCTNLVTSPMLSSMIGSTGCYYQMFYHCNSLQKAPELCIAILPTACYYGMFQGCSSLTYVKCLATDISATNCINSWLSGVSSTGTFIQASGVTWPRGASGIPTGWVDIEKRTMPSGYKQVLQVTSNGTAYIQLSFGFEETDEVAATFSVDTSQRTDKYIVCPQTWNNKNNRYGMGVHDSGHYTAAFGDRSTGTTVLSPKKANNGELHNWTYAAATFSVIDVSSSINVTGYTFGGITTNLRLFYGYNSNTKGAISSYKHIKGSTTACDFVAAVRESDNTAGLYDPANDEFMTCNGLTAGEEI